MKVVFLLLGVVISAECYAQLPVKDGSVFYEQIDSAPGLSKDEIFKRSKLWVVDAFVDAKEVIQIDNKEDGEIVGKGNLDCTYTIMGTGIPCRVYFTIKLNSKDGKHRVQIYDFSGHRYTSNKPLDFDKLLNKSNAAENKRIIEQIDKQIRAALAKLQSDLTSKKKDDF
jgi:hypothetical protein